ncbi:hypothetical protein FMEAI12_5140024 [Parafrankia sp. Ea1.12]|nr:hypothetical protein FMEAI12_5140024 [Parafrankia sp. Ea1.12]
MSRSFRPPPTDGRHSAHRGRAGARLVPGGPAPRVPAGRPPTGTRCPGRPAGRQSQSWRSIPPGDRGRGGRPSVGCGVRPVHRRPGDSVPSASAAAGPGGEDDSGACSRRALRCGSGGSDRSDPPGEPAGRLGGATKRPPGRERRRAPGAGAARRHRPKRFESLSAMRRGNPHPRQPRERPHRRSRRQSESGTSAEQNPPACPRYCSADTGRGRRTYFKGHSAGTGKAVSAPAPSRTARGRADQARRPRPGRPSPGRRPSPGVSAGPPTGACAVRRSGVTLATQWHPNRHLKDTFRMGSEAQSDITSDLDPGPPVLGEGGRATTAGRHSRAGRPDPAHHDGRRVRRSVSPQTMRSAVNHLLDEEKCGCHGQTRQASKTTPSLRRTTRPLVR